MFCGKFGIPFLVQDVRMFGFVTFVYAETVKQILANKNPHFVQRKVKAC